jgi:hypothetical protein
MSGKSTNKNRRKIMKKSSKRPIQSAPVVRTITGAPMSSGNGVEASGWFDDIVGAVKTYGPAVAQAAPGILGAFGI